MTECKLTNGEHILAVRTEHNVKRVTYTTALTDYFYNEGENFPEKLTKKKAEKILRRSLFFWGTQGQFEDGYFEATYEEGQRYNDIYENAYEWVGLKYEWLSKTDA